MFRGCPGIRWHDMTARRQDSDVLRSDREIEAILSGISDGFASLDNEWRFTHVNPAAERLWRRPAAELVGQKALNVLKIDPDNVFQTSYIESKRTGLPVAFSAYSANFDVWLEIRGFPHPGGFTIFARDVTGERRAHLDHLERERRLEAAQRTNQRIFETTLDLILVVDRQGNIIQVSPSVHALLGYRPEE